MKAEPYVITHAQCPQEQEFANKWTQKYKPGLMLITLLVNCKRFVWGPKTSSTDPLQYGGNVRCKICVVRAREQSCSDVCSLFFTRQSLRCALHVGPRLQPQVCAMQPVSGPRAPCSPSSPTLRTTDIYWNLAPSNKTGFKNLLAIVLFVHIVQDLTPDVFPLRRVTVCARRILSSLSLSLPGFQLGFRGMGSVLPRIRSHHWALTQNEGGISVDHLPDLCAPLPFIRACLHS